MEPPWFGAEITSLLLREVGMGSGDSLDLLLMVGTFLGSKITAIVIAAMKLKDTYSLEGKL